jgi:hypothetical protein
VTAKLARIPTGNVALDRWQDEVISKLNPVLARRILSGEPAPVVTGSKGGNAALASLIAALAELGLVKDETT